MVAKLHYEKDGLRLRQCQHGPLLYNANDIYVGRSLDLYGEYSESESGVFAQILKPGWTAVELGSHMGSHTIVLGQAVGPTGRVVAFEPQRALFNILCANLALNGLTNTIAHCAGAGDTPGKIHVRPIDYSKEGNFGGVELGGSKGEEVPVLTVDGLGLDACHFMKIDVEGMELQALQGAAATVAKFRPALYIENDRQAKSADLIGWLLDQNYRIYWHLPRFYRRNNFAGRADNVFGPLMSLNMLCLPKEASQNIDFLEVVDRNEWPKPGTELQIKASRASGG